MIVKNEEQTLKKCLLSVKDVVDEIIIVDTGSTDRTKKAAAQFTDKIYDFKWIDDFSAARNYSFKHATMDYILWLDADDIMLPEDAAAFMQLKKILSPDINAVMLKYNTGFDKDGKVTFSFYRERLVKRAAGFVWKEPVHEYIETWGNVKRSGISITHTKKHRTGDGRNLRIYEKILKNKGELSPRGTYYYARELFDEGLHSEAVKYFQIFLSSGKGWIEDNIEACCLTCDCLTKTGDTEGALQHLLKSFEYDIPRPKAACRLGDYFIQKKSFAIAAYWYQLALNYKNVNSLGFVQADYQGYLPCVQLAVCYSNLGDNQKAFEYNEKAAEYRPDCPSVLSNRAFFKSVLSKDNP